MSKLLITVCICGMLVGITIYDMGYTTKNIASDFEATSHIVMTNESFDLLIITPSQFSQALEQLVIHKDAHGIKTKLVELEDIYIGEYFMVSGRDNAEKIKYFIKDALETWGIEFVLLIGGRKPSITAEEWLLPVRYSHIEDNVATLENVFISDLYFADIYNETGAFSSWDTNDNGVFSEWLANKPAADIMDLRPDVYLGRLPCRNTFEVKIMVEKIISYESTKCEDSWFKKWLW